MDWLALVSTAAGAVIAFGGTIIADVLRRRDSRHRWDYEERRKAYSELILALGDGLEGLRQVARSELTGDERVRASAAAVGQAGVYTAREKLLMAGDSHVIRAAEGAFEALISVRDGVRAGGDLASAAYHDAYHPFARAFWDLRMAIRRDLGAGTLRPGDIGRESWDGRESCAACMARDAAPRRRPSPRPAEPLPQA